MTTGSVARGTEHQQIAWIGGSVHEVVFDGTATEGRLTAFRSTMRAGAASPVHIHDEDDETIFMVEGTGVFWAGDQRWEVGPGDAVFLPRRVPHSYTFTSDAAILTVCNPAGMETFFRAVGWDLEQPVPPHWAVDMEKLRVSGEATGQHVLGPPLAADDSMPTAYLT